MNKKIACIDVGTNSITSVIASNVKKKINIIDENYQIVRLGEGIEKTKYINNKAIERCISAFEIIKSNCIKHNVNEIVCVATSALRDAKNSRNIIQLIKRRFNIQLSIIDGLKEAEIVSLAAKYEFNLIKKKVLIFDIGGGSTELIFVENNLTNKVYSYQIGTVRCTESFLCSHPPSSFEINNFENYIDQIFRKLPNINIMEGIGIAGTITTLASIKVKSNNYDSKLIHKSSLSLEEIINIKNKIIDLSLKQKRQIIGLDEKRAEVIIAGIIICIKIMQKYNLIKISVSDRGLRWGLLYQNLFNL